MRIPDRNCSGIKSGFGILFFLHVSQNGCRRQIRLGVIGYVRDPDLQDRQNLSEYLQDKCHREYSFLSKLFTELQGISIEKYSIQQRIERVKELLFYDELSVSEIADKLHYSSVAHLSTQFKSQTGLSPTQFKMMKGNKLKPLDEI